MASRGPRTRPLLDRMADKFTVGDGCWEWRANATPQGYGFIKLTSSRASRMAHRVLYEIMVGPIPDGLFLDHLCRNPRCVRPDHLEPVTPGENVRRGNAGINNRTKTHCPQGHAYDEENTVRTRGARRCRSCMRAQRQARNARLVTAR